MKKKVASTYPYREHVFLFIFWGGGWGVFFAIYQNGKRPSRRGERTCLWGERRGGNNEPDALAHRVAHPAQNPFILLQNHLCHHDKQPKDLSGDRTTTTTTTSSHQRTVAQLASLPYNKLDSTPPRKKIQG